ncbi:MAG: LCP family protein [Oscillospiraceae bacterium]|nr:LCP family protein [Oscillospiraceae bacterium]
MAKKSAKVAVTYIVTIIITLLVAGGICWYLMDSFLFGEKDDSGDEIYLEKMTSSQDYTASAADNKTVLLILDAEKRETASCFLVARFLAEEQQIVFMPMPSNTRASVNGTEDTLYNFYRNGGSASAVKSIESCTGVTIDKYIKFNKESFSTIVDIFGGVNFNVPYNLVYDNPDTGEETVIKAGETFLDSTLLRKVITYPNYNSGEEYRAKCLGITITDMVNSIPQESFSSHLDDYFTAVINSDIETNITAYDYEDISDAMKYVISNSSRLAVFVPTSGSEDEEGRYILDENFVRSINEWLKIYDDEDGSLTVSSEVVFPE